jgi:hypothetical protein
LWLACCIRCCPTCMHACNVRQARLLIIHDAQQLSCKTHFLWAGTLCCGQNQQHPCIFAVQHTVLAAPMRAVCMCLSWRPRRPSGLAGCATHTHTHTHRRAHTHQKGPEGARLCLGPSSLSAAWSCWSNTRPKDPTVLWG